MRINSFSMLHLEVTHLLYKEKYLSLNCAEADAGVKHW